jgi:hypothetical protein
MRRAEENSLLAARLEHQVESFRITLLCASEDQFFVFHRNRGCPWIQGLLLVRSLNSVRQINATIEIWQSAVSTALHFKRLGSAQSQRPLRLPLANERQFELAGAGVACKSPNVKSNHPS